MDVPCAALMGVLGSVLCAALLVPIGLEIPRLPPAAHLRPLPVPRRQVMYFKFHSDSGHRALCHLTHQRAD